MKKLLTALLLMSTGHLLYSQAVQNFELQNTVDGTTISLNTFSGQPAVVLIFFSNNCPFDSYYLQRLKALDARYGSKIPVLLVNAYPGESESIPAMMAYVKEKSISLPYLADKDQKVLTNLNARKSPECFLLQSVGGKFTIAYRGALDDNPQSADDVTRHYLQEAIEKILTGQKIEVKEVRPVGCSIQRK
jgi:hypothetical protein